MKRNHEKRHSRRFKMTIISLILVLALVPSISIFALSSVDDEDRLDVASNELLSSLGKSGLGSSGKTAVSSIPLGLSATMLETEEELQDLANRVNDGTEPKETFYQLANDMNLTKLDKWTTIGTEEHPFQGYFDGGEFTVSGIGSEDYSSLFGYVDSAIIQNLNIQTTKVAVEPNPYFGLLVKSVNTTITNVHINAKPITASFYTPFANTVTMDDSWYTTGGSPFTIDTPGKLLGLHQLVNVGNAKTGGAPYDFHGDTINITDNINMSGIDTWEGIGTKSNPFCGTVVMTPGKQIQNFKVQGKNDFGLFGHTGLGAKLENISLVSTNISGGNSVGALVGVATDTIIENCSVSGKVQGDTEVGGLIGTMYYASEATSGGDDPISMVKGCYSTADVTGSMFVGGIVGVTESQMPFNASPSSSSFIGVPAIQICFSTGNIKGSYRVGGILGGAKVNTSSFCNITVTECASNANVSGSKVVGGIAGFGEQENNGTLVDYPLVRHSYFAGNVKGTEFLGGLVGGGGAGMGGAGAYTSYLSGYVISPLAVESDLVWQGSGELSSGAIQASMDIYADPNSIYRPDNVLNKDVTTPNASAYKKDTSPTSSGPFNTVNFFDDNLTTDLGESAVFERATLVYSGAASNNPVNIPTAGSFPKLKNFADPSLPPAFKIFSNLSTDVSTKSLPMEIYRNSAGKASATPNGTAISLPTGSGQVVWKVEGNTSFEFADPTLKTGKNKVTIQGNDILIDQPANEDVVLNIEAAVPSVPGFKMSYQVTLKDEAVRPLYGEMSNTLSNSLADAKANKNDTIPQENIHYIPFRQTIAGTGTGTVDLTVYSDNNYSAGATTVSGAVNYSVIDGKLLKITLPLNTIKVGQSYKFSLAAGNVTETDSGIDYVQDFYFRTQKNEAPKLTFDATHALATDSQTTLVGNTQTVYLTENNYLDGGIFAGILVENESYINLETTPNAGTLVLPISPSKTMAGEGDYAHITPAQIDETNFFTVPGEYVVEYKIPDPEDATLTSNTIRRVYRINSSPRLQQGGQPLQLFVAEFESQEVINIFSDMDKNNKTLENAIKDAIKVKYVTTASDKQLKAYSIGYDKKLMNLSFDFKVNGVDENVFKDGFDSALEFDVAGETFTYLLSMQGLTPNREILLDETNYTVDNHYTRPEAIRHFNAVVIRKSDGQPTGERLVYDFSKVKPDVYGRPQEVTITLETQGSDLEIPGVDLTVSAKATVVINRVYEYKHPEDKENTVEIFWDNTFSKIKSAPAGKTINIPMAFSDAQETPRDFFILLGRKENVTVNFTLPSGAVMSFNSDKLDSDMLEGELTFMMGIEPMYDMYIIRDTQGAPAQQFFAPEYIQFPGKITVTMDLSDSLPSEGLNLYHLDEVTNTYTLVRSVTQNEISSGKLKLNTSQIGGKYIITAVDLENQESSAQ